MSEKIVINLGCGTTKIPGSIGVDCVSINGFVDVVHDLNSLPYPFEDCIADEIHFYHVLEHLDNPLLVLEEVHRLIKPNGLLHLRVPHFSSNGAFTDITHKRPFSYFSFDVFLDGSYHSFYTKVRFIMLQRQIKYFGLYPNSGTYAQYIHPNKCNLLLRPFVRILNWLIALSPMAFERFWCYYVGGACEISLIMRKK